MGKKSNGAFEYLQLNKKKDKLFDSPEVFTWITFVKETTRSDAEAIEQMSKTLNELVKPKHDLVKALGGMNKNHKLYETVQQIRRQWIQTQGSTFEEIYNILGFDKLLINDVLTGPELPLLGTWMHQNGFKNSVYLFDILRKKGILPPLEELKKISENENVNALNREMIIESIYSGYYAHY